MAALGIDNGELAAVGAGELVLGEELRERLFGREPLAEQLEAARSVPDVHVGLGGDRADARLRPGHYRSDREVAGSDRDAPIAVHRIIGDDREGVDVRREGASREKQERQQAHRLTIAVEARGGGRRRRAGAGVFLVENARIMAVAVRDHVPEAAVVPVGAVLPIEAVEDRVEADAFERDAALEREAALACDLVEPGRAADAVVAGLRR